MQKFLAVLAIFMLVTFAVPSYANTSYESETSETDKPGKPKKTRKTKVAKETREVREMREARRMNDSADTVVGYTLTKTEIDDESMGDGSKIFIHHMFSENFGIDITHANYGKYSKDFYFGSWLVSQYNVDLQANNISAIVSTSADDVVSYYGKLGVSMWVTEPTTRVPYDGLTKGNDLLLGLGVRVNAGSMAVFKLEYETIKIDDGDVASFSLGVGIRF